MNNVAESTREKINKLTNKILDMYLDQDYIPDHDCHAGPEDSCPCQVLNKLSE